MPVMYAMLVLTAAGISFYFYKFSLRSMAAFGLPRTAKAVALCIALGVAAATAAIPDVTLLVALHIMVISGILGLLHRLAGRVWAKQYPNSPVSRVYASGILPLLLTTVILLGGYWNMANVVRTEYTVTTQKPIRAQGYTVALIADVHYGVSLDREALEAVCDRISGQSPDVVVLCGDIIDDSTAKEQIREVFQILGAIKSEYGVFYVYGNHDRPFSARAGGCSREELDRFITEGGITILEDTCYAVTSDLVLAGRDDRGYNGGVGRLPVEKLLVGVDPDAFILTLDHQPNEYKENGEAGTDLLLSGHTHGGQIWPANLIDSLFRFNDAVYGHTWIDEDSQAIVTSGLAGWRWPIKTASPAEYVIIHIQNREEGI